MKLVFTEYNTIEVNVHDTCIFNVLMTNILIHNSNENLIYSKDKTEKCFCLHVRVAKPSKTRVVHLDIHPSNTAHCCLTSSKGKRHATPILLKVW